MATFSTYVSVFFVITLIVLPNSYGIKWLALGREEISWDGRLKHIHCGSLRGKLGIARGQAKICRDNVELMPYVSRAAAETMQTCQHIFQTRRWNCSSILFSPNYTPDLTTGTREQAFVYALSSASLTYILSKACAAGDLFNCSCSVLPKESPSGGFKWGGCGDNVRWATKFAKRFIESPEKKLLKDKASPKTKRGSAAPTADLGAVIMGPSSSTRVPSKTQQAPINIHNARAGRREMENSLKTQCTCHGVSGSCSVKTCWKGLPRFSDIGERLQMKYAEAIEVSVKALGEKKEMMPVRRNTKSFSEDDLIYPTKSPDYCIRDDRTGSLGTRGRTCNETSQDYDSCDVMCCGRGHTTVIIKTIEMCKCKFRWCCDVVCKKCVRYLDTHICN